MPSRTLNLVIGFAVSEDGAEASTGVESPNNCALETLLATGLVSATGLGAMVLTSEASSSFFMAGLNCLRMSLIFNMDLSLPSLKSRETLKLTFSNSLSLASVVLINLLSTVFVTTFSSPAPYGLGSVPVLLISEELMAT